MLGIILRRWRFAYITVADPVVSMLPRAEGTRQRLVGSLLVLLGSRRLPARLWLLVDLRLVGRTGLVEGSPHLVMLGLLCPWSAAVMDGVGGLQVV